MTRLATKPSSRTTTTTGARRRHGSGSTRAVAYALALQPELQAARWPAGVSFGFALRCTAARRFRDPATNGVAVRQRAKTKEGARK